MLQKLTLAELKPGMYVAEVVEQSGNLKVKSRGLVRTDKAIETLKKQGVQAVMVDFDKSDLGSEQAPAETEEPQTSSLKPKVSFDNEIGKATKLYDKAKEIQEKAFEDMKAGREIDTGAMKDVADGFIDSVFRNPDALACMTRMRDKDAYLMEHSVNVSIIMTIFARYLGFDQDLIHELATGALLHDLGKIGVPDPVLNKPGRLTDDEMVEMRSHVTLGYDVLKRSGDLSDVSLEVVRDHHERLDGNGYPDGKTAEALSKYARMIAIVDTYDAITATRCYQTARTPITAFKILRAESGTSFDGDLVTEFIACMGIHPVGTLVKMKSNKLGFVVESNYVNPLSPKVKLFYSITNKGYIPPKLIDLAASGVTDEIDKSVKPEEFRIDMLKFFKDVLVP